MQLLSLINNAVPDLSLVMGIASWYFAIEEFVRVFVFGKGMGLAVFLSVSALLLLTYGLNNHRQRHTNKAAG